MFSQACVKNSVHSRGCVHTPLCKHLPGRHHPGHTTPLGRHLPRQTDIAADSTHPTGMHSCSIFVSNTIHKIYMTQKCLLKV